MKLKIPQRGLIQLSRLPPPDSKDKDGGRKRKHQDDLISSCTSKSKDVPHNKATSSSPPSSSFYLPWLAQTGEFLLSLLKKILFILLHSLNFPF
jgi:hypothetical protein